MSLGRRFSTLCLAGLALGVSACSGGGGGSSTKNTLSTALQDLTQDPNGLTTVLDFASSLGNLTAANFESDGGQNALTVTINGTTATITWDGRVTPSHQVRVVGAGGVKSEFVAVTTSDATTPTFTATATQTAGLGGDVITVSFTGGPRVEPTSVSTPASWSFDQNGSTLSLAGSTFSFNAATQVLQITTDAAVNVHSSFDLTPQGLSTVADVAVPQTVVNGFGAGDAVAPNLVSADQNLTIDPLGTVIDFTFDEAMDPPTSAVLSNFAVGSPDLATQAIQVPGSPEILRVTFNNPMLPGTDDVTLTNLMDAHGNELNAGTPLLAPHTSTGAVAAAYDPVNTVATTIENTSNDQIVIVTDQALEADAAENTANWTMLQNGATNLIPSITSISYDQVNATLTVDLSSDLLNGDTVDLTALNIPEIDGQLFASTIQVIAAGDAQVPSIQTVVQNRNQDPSGQTLDVTFSEDVDAVTSTNLGNWTISGGVNILTATQLVGQETIRLTTDAIVLPVDNTLDAANVLDIAGNSMVAAVGVAVTSSDSSAPTPSNPSANAIAGEDNDTVVVSFDDTMIQAEVETPGNWTVESPIGSPLSTTNATVSYSSVSNTATLVFDGGDDMFFKREQTVRVALASMRDFGGNAVDSTPLDGMIVSEGMLPTIDSVWVDGIQPSDLTVRFSEHVDHTDDIGGVTTYVVRDSSQTVKGQPTTATPTADGLGVTLVFPFAVLGTDTLDASGVSDLAGNPMVPAQLHPIQAEDANPPALSSGNSVFTAVSGERNDTIDVVFSTNPGSWGRLDSANYTVVQGVTPVDLTGASFSWDSPSSTVTILLDQINAESLQQGVGYDITIQNLISEQGIPMGGPDLDAGLVAGGDSTGPGLVASRSRIDAANPADSVIVEIDEAYDPADLVTLGNVQLNAVDATSITAIGPRTLRASFAAAPGFGDTISINLDDLAGNNGVAGLAIENAFTGGPLLSAVTGTAVPGVGGDLIEIDWAAPVVPSGAVNLGNYAIESPPGSAIDLTGATATYVGGAQNRVAILLADGVELDASAGTVQVTATGIVGPDGILMTPGVLSGPVGGDMTAPSFSVAFADYRFNPLGFHYDVIFTEDVDSAAAMAPSNWQSSGGIGGFAVTQLRPDHYRVEYSLPLGAGDSIEFVSGLMDMAGNAAGALSTPAIQ